LHINELQFEIVSQFPARKKKGLMFPASAEFIHKLATGQNNWPQGPWSKLALTHLATNLKIFSSKSWQLAWQTSIVDNLC